MSKLGSWRRLAPVLMSLAVGTGSTGCGVIGWAVTPRAEVVHYTIPHVEEVEVRSMPEGAMVLVDGAEAGRTPKSVKVPLTEVRAQRRQSVIPGLTGMLVDMAAFGILSALAFSENAPEAGLVIAGIGLGVTGLDGYLNFGRSTANEASELLPVQVEIGVQQPGYVEQRRRIRVPDITELDFLLAPTAAARPAEDPAPSPPAPEAPASQPAPADSPRR